MNAVKNRVRALRDGATETGVKWYDIVSVDAPSSISIDDVAHLSMTVECVGGIVCEEQDARISFGGTELTRETVGLVEGEQQTIDVFTAGFNEPGTFTLQFAIGNQAKFREIEVVGGESDLASHDIVSVSAPDQAHFRNVELSMTVTCPSSTSGCVTQTATISVADDVLLEQNVSLSPGEERTLTASPDLVSTGSQTFQFAIGNVARFRTVEVVSDTDNGGGTVTIDGCSNVPSSVAPGESFQPQVTLTNSGSTAASVTVRVEDDEFRRFEVDRFDAPPGTNTFTLTAVSWAQLEGILGSGVDVTLVANLDGGQRVTCNTVRIEKETTNGGDGGGGGGDGGGGGGGGGGGDGGDNGGTGGGNGGTDGGGVPVRTVAAVLVLVAIAIWMARQ